jgi:poly(3-hydroxybutyrate) depolymerase
MIPMTPDPAPTNRGRLAAAAVVLALATTVASAASTVVLPHAFCPASDPLLRDGFDAAFAVPHSPSNGSGGAGPGDVTRTIAIPGVGMRSYYLHVPAGYTPARAWPLLLALRGASVPTAPAAQQVRSDWSGWADTAGFIVIAPVGESTQGGWGAAGDASEISTALDDALAAYNVERSRVYLWGFSAGGHYGHALALDNTSVFAAYGVSAGALQMYACSDNGSFQPACSSWLPTVQPKIPVDIHIGNGDPLYTSGQVDARHDGLRFDNGGWTPARDLWFVVFAGGHTYSVAQLGEIWNHICPFALGP